MESPNQGEAVIAVEPILARASQIEEAMLRAAEVRRESFDRLTEQVRDLAALNGDLNHRVDEMEIAKAEAESAHAQEVASLLERIRTMEETATNVASEHAQAIADSQERERALEADLNRMTDSFTRVAREFERFVDGVGRETVAAVEAADQAERNLVTLHVPAASRAPAPAAQRLPETDNLIRMPLPATRDLGRDPELDVAAAMAEAAQGFGRMFGGEQQ